MGTARTVENFVDDMLSKKRHWTAILSVARVVRGGSWASKAKTILRERGIVPQTDEELNRIRDEILLKDRKNNEEAMKREVARRKKKGGGGSTDPALRD